MPIWVPFITAILGALVGSLFTSYRDHAKLKRDAKGKFRSSFAEAITQFENKDPYVLMNQFKVNHDVAIHEFRDFVGPALVHDFDNAAEEFRLLRAALPPALISFFDASRSGEPVDKTTSKNLMLAIENLMTFAK